jgi:carbonic anhydrase
MFLQLIPGNSRLRATHPTCFCQFLSSISTTSPVATGHRIRPSADADINAHVSPDKYHILLARNKEWASKTSQEQFDLFPTLAEGQSPEILWIGCADSRCPETTILGANPGDVFVHRNIANVIHHNDLSSAAVIEYAVKYLKVKHVVLCGHTCCGGVSAALGNKKLGIIDPWLMPLRRLREENLEVLEALDPKEAVLKLVKLNVLQGVRALKENPTIIEAMQDRDLEVHGLLYDIATGVLQELETKEPVTLAVSRVTAFKTAS